jgi:hypothetical protein
MPATTADACAFGGRMTAGNVIRGRFALALNPEGRTPMTPISWQGHTAVIAQGDEPVEVDCSRLITAMAPVDITTRIERIEVVIDHRGERALTMAIDDTGRAVLATGFSQRPYGDVAVSIAGVVFSLGAVQFHADESEDAQLNLHFEQPGELAEVA